VGYLKVTLASSCFTAMSHVKSQMAHHGRVVDGGNKYANLHNADLHTPLLQLVATCV